MARELNIIVKVDKDSAKAGLTDLERGVQTLTESSQQQEKAMKAALGVLTAQSVRQFVGDLKAAASEFITAFSEQEKATRSLAAALQTAGSFTPQLAQQYDMLATHFENTTVFSDELILSMESLLTQVGSVAPSQMQNALKAATDLSAGLGIDLRTATLLVAKAFEGHTETLGRYGIVLDETKVAADPVKAVLEGINEKFGGQAQAQLDTYAGKMQHLSNRMNNTQESAGELLTSGINPLLAAFGALEGPVQTAILGFVGIASALAPAALGFAALAPSIAVLATSNLPLLTTALGAAGKALAMLAPAVAVVATAFASWEIGRWIGETSGLTDEFERFGAVMMGTSLAEVDATIAAREHAKAMQDLEPLIAKASRSLPTFTANMRDSRMSMHDAEYAMKVLEDETKELARVSEEAGRKLAQRFTKEMEANTKAAEAMEKVEKDVRDTLRALADNYWKEQIQIAEAGGKKLIEMTLQLNQSLISLDDERTRHLLAVNTPGMFAAGSDVGKKVGDSFSQSMLGSINGALKEVGPAIVAALEGGGDKLRSVGSAMGLSFSKHMFGNDKFTSMITTHFGGALGDMINSILPGIGAIVGPLVAKIGSFFANVFGGPNAQEKAGRSASDAFTQQLAGTLDWMQKIEVHQLVAAGNSEKWATQVVAIRDAYIKAGHSVDEALAVVDRLFKAEKQGGNAVQVVIDDITRAMHDTVPAAALAEAAGTAAFDSIGAAATAAGQAATESAQQAAAAWADVQRMYGVQLTGGEGTSEGRNESNILRGYSSDQAKRIYETQIAPGSTDQDWDRVKSQYGFHSGGVVLPFVARAHSGLAIDEVPIIAQTGEGVLSRRGMRSLGGPSALDSLNRGGGGGVNLGGVTVNVGGNLSEHEFREAVSDGVIRKMKRQGFKFRTA